MIRMLGIACCVFVGLASGSAFACTGQITGESSEGTTAIMVVKSGVWCGTRFRGSLGPTYGVKFLQRPAHGTVRVDSRQGVYYRARPGYVGSDRFVYARYGLDAQGNPRTAVPAVITVNVVP